tara:strand:- start:9593 stop:11197 length:1605 start_codon:yes stop_codon:yes gene_type:complete
MAFFIMKNNKFIALIFLSYLLSFYNFDFEDWFFVSEPDIIKSMTQDAFSIHFLSDDNIYSYDIISEEFFYNFNLSINLPDEEKFLIHYQKDIDYFFVMTQNYLLYKSSVGSYWNEKRYSDFNISSIHSIKKIGFTNNYIIIETNNNYKVIDYFSMVSSNYKNIDHIMNIEWINNNINNLDLSKFYTIDNSLIGEKYIQDEADVEHFVISSMYDSYENLWIGMNTGAIYKVDDISYNINRVNVGPRVDYVSNIFNDNNGNWYFFDNSFRRTGKKIFDYNGYLLSIWNENSNDWIHIPKNQNIMINNIILNNVKRLDKFILFTTFDGLIVYDIEFNSWYHNYDFLDIKNRVLWDLVFDDEHIYFSSSFGLIICDYLIINDKLKIYENTTIINDAEIYDIKNMNDDIYFSSSKGLYKYNLDSNKMQLIDLNIYYNIKIFESYILGSNKNLWYIDTFGRELISNNINYFNTNPNGEKICATNLNEIKIIDFKSQDEWFLNLSQLNINEPIYSVDCDSDWLWFPISSGISFFKWSNYEK